MFYKFLIFIVLLIILIILLISFGILPHLSIVGLSSDNITAIATVILALITAWYVKLTNKMLEETKKAASAKIYLDLEVSQDNLKLIVGNTGKTPATDIKIKIKENIKLNEQFSTLDRIKDAFPLKNGISYLSPDKIMIFNIHNFDYSKVNNQNSVVEFDIEYKDFLNNKIHLFYKLNLRQFENTLISSFQDQTANIIAKAIYSLERDIKFKTHAEKFNKKQCPSCKEFINKNTEKCHYCLEFIHKKETTN